MSNANHPFYSSLLKAVEKAQEEGILRIINATEDAIAVEYIIELPQFPICKINSVEPVLFDYKGDFLVPIPYFARADFPNLPHLLIGTSTYKSPCLVQSDFDNLALNWNAAFYIRRVYEWLYHSARGTLHQEDQRLEVFMLMDKGNLIRQVETYLNPEESLFIETKDFGHSKSYYLKNTGSAAEQILLLNFKNATTEHKVIQPVPSNLQELDSLLRVFGVNTLCAELEEAIKVGLTQKRILVQLTVNVLDNNLGTNENQQYAFLFEQTLGEIGKSLFLLGEHEGGIVPLIGASIAIEDGKHVKVLSLSVNDHFNQPLGRVSNGELPNHIFPTATQIGVGALGYGIAEGLTRTGFLGKLFIIDHDIFLPHNTSRWILSKKYGIPKVEILSQKLNEVFTAALRTDKKEDYCDSICDKLQLGKLSQPIRTAINRSSLVIDSSASSIVQRTLDVTITNERERFTMFCSPSGESLITFYTPIGSSSTHTSIEMSLYKKLIHEQEIESLFRTDQNGFTYGGDSCRSISQVLSTHDLAIASAISANLIERFYNSDSDFLGIWMKTEIANYNLLEIQIDAYNILKMASGTTPSILVSKSLTETITKVRLEKLPNETGGALIGHFDIINNILYVVDCIQAPIDSKETPVSFQRGLDGVEDELDRISSITHGNLFYVGEWHSHPTGCKPIPSADDKKQIEWLRNQSYSLHFPYVMMIMGDSTYTINF